MKRFSMAVLVWLALGAIPLQAQPVVDLGGISNDGGAFANFGINDGTNNEKVAQRFIGITGTIVQVKIGLVKVGNPGDNVVISVRQGSPDGPLLGVNATVAGASVSATTGSYYALTVGPFQVFSGTNYFAVFERSSSSDAKNFYKAIRGTSGSLSGGVTSGDCRFLRTGVGWTGSNLTNSFILSLMGYPAPSPPTIPTGLAAVPTGNQVALTWNLGVEPALAYYKIYRSQANGFIPTSSDSIGRVNKPTVSFTDAGLTLGTYYYRVAAVDSFNSVSGPSVQVIAVVVSAIAPPIMGALAPMLSLDSVLVGASGQKTLVISNTGGSNLSVTGIAIGGTDASQFSAAPNSAVIASGGAQNVTITFSPTSTGAKTASLTLIHNAAGSPTVINLSGYGSAVPVPGISVSTAALAMDSTNTGASSQKTITVTNTGTATLTVSSAALSGADAPQFAVVPASATIGAGANQIFTVTFAPASVGAKSASLTITHNAAGSSTVISLTGIGKTPPAGPAPVFSIVPSSVVMDSTNVGSTSQKTFTITNTGAAILSVGTITVGGANSSEFGVAPISANIGAGGSQVFTLTFSPASAGAKSASLAISHNTAGSPFAFVLSGTGNVVSSGGSGGVVSPPPPGPITIDFIATNTQGKGTLSTKFIVSISPMVPLRHIWLITGAGDTIRSVYESYVYNRPGKYTVKLEVLTEAGQNLVVEKKDYIVVLDSQPSVDFTASPLNGEMPLTVRFKSSNLGGSITTYRWDFGDSSIVSVSTDSVSHVYTKAGVYTVVLSVTGSGGADIRTKSGLINVSLPPAPAIKLSTVSLVLDSVLVGSKSSKLVLISNTGTADLLVKSVTVLGPDAAQFTVSQTTAIVAPGLSQAIMVTFSPISAGPKSASLAIIHGAAGSTVAVALTGTGLGSPDFNGDGQVSLDDFFLFSIVFGQKTTKDNTKFDLDGDGQIGFTDFFIISAAFGK